MTRYIGKCMACKKTVARDYTELKRMDFGKGIYAYTANVAGRMSRGRFLKAADDIECPACGENRWNAKKVKGYTTEHACDARCTEAKGHICECACGGKNHGALHLNAAVACEKMDEQ